MPWTKQWRLPLPDIRLMALLANKTESLFFPVGLVSLPTEILCVRKGCLFLDFCPVTERPCEDLKILCVSEQLGCSHFTGVEQMLVGILLTLLSPNALAWLPKVGDAFSSWMF